MKKLLTFGVLAAVAMSTAVLHAQGRRGGDALQNRDGRREGPTPRTEPLSNSRTPPNRLPANEPRGDGVTKIQDGVLKYSAEHYLADQLLRVGFDPYGYNYQAHAFRGYYVNAYLGKSGFPPYQGDDEAYLAENPGAVALEAWPHRKARLMMKWNDAFISNVDRDTEGDGVGVLDTHYGFDGYIGSGAWLMNHISDVGQHGQKVQLAKIVAAPADAEPVKVEIEGESFWFWQAADGKLIGPVLWGEFAIIQQIFSGRGAKDISPFGPGLGKFKP